MSETQTDPVQEPDPTPQPAPASEPDPPPPPPADPANPDPPPSPPPQQEDPPPPPPAASGDNVVHLQAGVARERDRVAEIVELCQLAGFPAMELQLIKSGTPVAQARRMLASAKAAAADALVTIPPHQSGPSATRAPVGPNHREAWAGRTYNPAQRN